MSDRVILTVGTKKGVFVAEAAKTRQRFALRGPSGPGVPVYATLANDYESVISSINTSKPAILNGKSPYARSIRQMVDRIVGGSSEAADGRSGFMGRITGMFRIPTGAGKKES